MGEKSEYCNICGQDIEEKNQKRDIPYRHKCKTWGEMYNKQRSVNGKMSEYEEHANRFLEVAGLEFSAVLKGDKCPMWCDGKHIHGHRYIVEFKRKNPEESTRPLVAIEMDFWNSLNDKEKGKDPTAYDVLAAMEKYDPGDFEDFCDNYGYDTDSRKAEATHKAVVEEWEKLQDFLTAAEIELLSEIA
ncbi:hypothetical protein KAR91_06815 [Candidatus Pacearchaeota archaeon]|nr:hypothetical protein [Candidatus Pacearchaeota archaeon]